jgi:hypothetical protein
MKGKKSNVRCGNLNCKKRGHTTEQCWAKGGGQEGQGPRQKDSKKGEAKAEASANVVASEELFAFTCTSDFAAEAAELQDPKERRGAIVDSGASRHFCPNRSQFR